MAAEQSLWDEWWRGLADGTSLESRIRMTRSEVLVALLEDPGGGDSRTRAAIAHALAVRLQRARDDAEAHDETVRGLARRNQDATRAARANVVSARSSNTENERILENRAREKNVGARLRFNMRSTDDRLRTAEERLDASERLDETLAETSRAYAERARSDAEEKDDAAASREREDVEAAS